MATAGEDNLRGMEKPMNQQMGWAGDKCNARGVWEVWDLSDGWRLVARMGSGGWVVSSCAYG
ncbi:hypothetical protein EBB07_24270 [Paenibacillaceae bacterium]|nr:hypothetical protein EBB07_24270 [Paenibacillaceae bacterium]